MSLLVDLLGLILLALLMPYLMVVIVVGEMLVELARCFYMPLLGLAASAAGASFYTLTHSVPDPSREWLGLVESFAQTDVAGLPMPSALLCLAVLLFCLAATKVLRRGLTEAKGAAK